MEAFWFWLLFVLIVLAVLAWPDWVYTRERWVYSRGGRWPYVPTATAVLVAILILLLFWFGIIAISWPWYAA